MTKEKTVEVYIPKGHATEDPNVFVSINGASYVLPKGKRVEVPAAVARELERSHRAALKRDDNAAELAERAKM